MRTLAEINSMSEEVFVSAFGEVAEHSPWVARGAALLRPFNTREEAVAAFQGVLQKASYAAQLALLRLHPDLATKAKLTNDSSREQASAGLSALSTEEFTRFNDLNTRYKRNFGFPFIFAVKGATKHQILESFENRVNNDKQAEFAMALSQVMRILRFRIEDRVQP